MKTKILILFAITIATFMKANAQTTCPTCSTTAIPTSISSTFAYSGNLYCINNDVVIGGGTTSFTYCNVKIAAGKKITVQNGATLNIIGSHFFSCTDIYGKTVLQKKVEKESSISLNIAGAKGYYFVNVTNTFSGKQSVSKILVQ